MLRSCVYVYFLSRALGIVERGLTGLTCGARRAQRISVNGMPDSENALSKCSTKGESVTKLRFTAFY